MYAFAVQTLDHYLIVAKQMETYRPSESLQVLKLRLGCPGRSGAEESPVEH